MLHKTDKGPVYGVRGVMHFFKEKSRFLPNRKRTHEKTYVFSHALFYQKIFFFYLLNLLLYFATIRSDKTIPQGDYTYEETNPFHVGGYVGILP